MATEEQPDWGALAEATAAASVPTGASLLCDPQTSQIRAESLSNTCPRPETSTSYRATAPQWARSQAPQTRRVRPAATILFPRPRLPSAFVSTVQLPKPSVWELALGPPSPRPLLVIYHVLPILWKLPPPTLPLPTVRPQHPWPRPQWPWEGLGPLACVRADGECSSRSPALRMVLPSSEIVTAPHHFYGKDQIPLPWHA